MKIILSLLFLILFPDPCADGFPYWHDLPDADKMVMGELRLERGLDGEWRVK